MSVTSAVLRALHLDNGLCARFRHEADELTKEAKALRQMVEASVANGKRISVTYVDNELGSDVQDRAP